MTDDERQGTDDNEKLERLISAAPPRLRPSDSVREQTFSALQDEWSGVVEQHSRVRRNRRFGVAAAASVVAAFLSIQLGLFDSDPAIFATVARQTGSGLTQSHADLAGDSRSLERVMVDSTVATQPDSRALLYLDGGGSVRLDTNTRLTILAPDQVRLERGALYFDSQGGDADRVSSIELEVITPAGVVRHLGTQYVVRVERTSTMVGVREGSVAIVSDSVSAITRAGNMISFDSSNRATERPLDAYAPVWNWVMEISPTVISQRTRVVDLLDWISRESGREIVFFEDAESVAETTIVDGLPEVDALTAVDALELATDLSLEVSAGRILVKLSSTEPTAE